MKPGGGGGGGGGGAAAPLGPRPERVYSHGLLLELKDHPLARQWPPYLDPAFKNSRGVWDPDRWHLERKRGETPVAGETKDGPDVGKEGRKTGPGLGPETEDLQQLVLSPQRRSFLGGCSSSGGPGGEMEVSLRPEPPGSKRVGSGRLIARQEEERAAPPAPAPGGPGAPGSFRRLGEDFKRFGGEKFGGGFRRDRDDENWGDDRRREGYFQHDERRDLRKNMEDRRPKRRNEPEWMNETISHNDIIELRGFEDPKAAKKKEAAAAPANLTESAAPRSQPRKKSDGDESKTEIGGSNKPLPAGLNNIDILSDLGIGSKTNDEFNFDAMMELMNSGNILGVGGPSTMTQHQQAAAPAAERREESRFSKFFNKGSEAASDPSLQGRRGSIQDELLGSNILKEINGEAGPVIKIPTPTEEQRYFAPISPAAQTRAAHNPILEMINKANIAPANHVGPQGPAGVKDLEEGLRRSLGLGGGHHPPPASVPQHHQAQNVQELFKQLQQGHNGQPALPPHHQMIPPRAPDQQPDSMSAFKKLVSSQFSIGRNFMFSLLSRPEMSAHVFDVLMLS